eukprot:TRINITY_DN3469_c0_g1_i1.p1 TRINITY_DN3469_c0_g1~~TRINITY_DN3469_c0_g1_i1.p1  ORF type:complete len:475 (-),score=68.48 TRINITY_DN3469_c0_g1_i1:1480-2904(-)
MHSLLDLCLDSIHDNLARLESLSVLSDELANKLLHRVLNREGLTKQLIRLLCAQQLPLRELDLADSSRLVDNTWLAALKSWNHLTVLRLTNCTALTESGLRHLRAVTNLLELDLTGCVSIGKRALMRVAELSSVNSLRLRGCLAVTDSQLKPVATMSHLTSLDISFCTKLTGRVFHVLTPLRLHLTALYLCGLAFEEGFGAIREFERISEVSFASCSTLSALTLTDIGNSALCLSVLDVSSCTALRPTDIQHFLPLFSSLRSLKLRDHQSITSELSRTAVTTCLTALDLAGCAGVTDETGQQLFRCLSQLQVLILAGCTSMADRTIAAIGAHLLQLRVLDLSALPRLSSAALRHVATLQRLSSLRLNHLAQLSVESLSTLPAVQLHELSVRGVHITCDVLNGWRRMDELRELDISHSLDILDLDCFHALSMMPSLQRVNLMQSVSSVNLSSVRAILSHVPVVLLGAGRQDDKYN